MRTIIKDESISFVGEYFNTRSTVLTLLEGLEEGITGAIESMSQLLTSWAFKSFWTVTSVNN